MLDKKHVFFNRKTSLLAHMGTEWVVLKINCFGSHAGSYFFKGLDLAVEVILTHSIFSRPWCLLEMVIAKRHGRALVPVFLQCAAGHAHFEFPDQDFYDRFQRDEILQLEQLPDGVLTGSNGALSADSFTLDGNIDGQHIVFSQVSFRVPIQPT